MNPEKLIRKARRAVESAQLLYEADDVDGACSRAYYAMFDAARAALLASGCQVPPGISKTHGGVISLFSEHLVKTGEVPVEMGKSLNRALEVRLVADYRGDSVGLEDTKKLVEQSSGFVNTLLLKYFPALGDNDDK